jgi:hypothetical protein
MISPRTNQWSLVLVLALLGSAAWAAEPNVPIHLEFEISPTPLGPYAQPRRDSVLYSLANRRPAYAVAIPLVPPLEWLPSPSRETMAGFLGRYDIRRGGWRQGYVEEHGGLSDQQKAFLQDAWSVYNQPAPNLVQRRLDPNGPECVLLYAVTLEDAKKMTQAYYQYARNVWWRGYLDSRVEKAKVTVGKVEREQKRLVEIEQLMGAAQKSLEEFQKTVPYRMESEAQEAIVELDRMLNSAQVEIAGIQAKMDRIMGYRTGPPPKLQLSPEAFAKLDMMLVEEDVALQGAAAREKKATSLREQASRFVELRSALTSATAEKRPLVEALEADGPVLEEQTTEVVAIRQQQPQIPAKVFIYPIEWSDEASQN